MVNTINKLTERNKELLNKIEELEQKYEPLHNQREFIERMIENGDKYRKILRSDNPWWNNPNNYYSTERCNFFDILTKSGNSHPSYELEPFVESLIDSHCRLERLYVQKSYDANRLWKEKDELTSEVANLTESLNHWKPRAEDAEKEVKELETKVEELEERVDIEVEMNLKALDKSKEWHDKRVFVENMKRDCTIIEQRIENDQLRKKLDAYKKKDKIKQVKKLANKVKIKVKNKVDTAKEKFNTIKEDVKQKFDAYILQNNK